MTSKNHKILPVGAAIFSTATVSVNPSGELKLTREQVWAGLVLKARTRGSSCRRGACTK